MQNHTPNRPESGKPGGGIETGKSSLKSSDDGRPSTKTKALALRGNFTTEKSNPAASGKSSGSPEKFLKLLAHGIDSWIESGKYLVSCINADPDFNRKVIELAPEISRELLTSLERAGRGEILPRLLIMDSRPGIKALLKRPISEQRKYESEPVTVIIANETLRVPVADLTKPQVKQVFGPDGIRSVQQQKQWLFDLSRKPQTEWKVVGSKILITGRSFFTAREIEKMLHELARK